MNVKRITTGIITTYLACCVSALCASFATAQAEREALALEEVIVSAQRREESAQSVAVSVSVFSEQQLANANVANAADLAVYTPSLSANTMFGPDNAAFNIRGFSKELRTAATVGVYFAEVVAPRGQIFQTSGDGAGPGLMFDLQNVQVLKGPQGTLFGRNTTGGAVLLMPRKPGEEFEGHLEFSAGNYQMLQQQAIFNLPVSDSLKVRVGLDRKTRDGHLNNLTNIGGDKFGDANYIAGRISALFGISDALENYTVLNYADSDTNGYTSKLFACNSSPVESPFNLIRPGACEGQLARQEAAGDDFYDIISTAPGAGIENKDLRLINQLTWRATDNLTVKNILSYMHLETINSQDLFGTQFTETQADLLGTGLPLGLADPNREFLLGYTLPSPDYPVTSQEAWVAELQLQGLSLGGFLQWQVGLYYENSRPDGLSGSLQPSTLSCELKTIITGDPSQFNCFDAAGGVIGGISDIAVKTEYTNQAVYGQATYDLSERVSLTGGLRYTDDKTEGFAIKERTRFLLNISQGTTVTEQSAVQESAAPTGLIELKYRPFEDVMTYAKYVRGYRQGGVNLATDTGIDTHDEEIVDNFELGLKSEFVWPIAGRFNIAVFDNDLKDMQLQSGFVSPTSGSTTAIFNAGRARIQGVEFDGTLQLFERLIANFSYSYLDSELLDQDLAANQQRVEAAAGPIGGLTFTPIAVEGDELPYTPVRSYTFALNYLVPVPEEWGRISIGGVHAYTGKQRATASEFSPFSVIDDFSVLNLHLNWSDVFQQPLDVSLFATNVLDEEYVTFIAGTYNATGVESRMAGQPRMYGARVKYHFGTGH